MAEWKIIRLGDCVATNQNTYSPKEGWQFVNYLDTGNITMNNINEIQYISTISDKLPSRARRKVQKNSIIYSTVRPNQLHYGIIKTQPDNFLVSTGFTVIDVNEKEAVPDYIYYVLTQQEITEHLQAIAEQSVSAYPSLKPSDIENLELLIPDIYTQRNIVAILCVIDKKIKQNTEINNNLEQQMQTLFKEFLSSNESGKLTTVEKVVLTANTGADAIQKAPIVDYDTGIRCIRVGDMTNSRNFYEWGFTKVTDKVFKRYQLHKDDIVVTRTASLGLNTIISEDLSAVYNNGLIRLTVDTSRMLPLYLYRQFQTEDFENYITRIESETSVRPNMKINYLLKYEFVLPSISKQSELIELLTPMLNKQNSLVSENKQLESLRDTLLPKLMSGELDVSGIDL